ncbi:hypothetical protein [Plantactinospora sp. KLBMP9567]|uniref:hypothetical protein n=1 Tax=Plantactinospora sp. KLBMP9567 TaxID=3085900 RepID=UPI0039906CEA
MGDSGSYGRAPDPGSAREEAERLVAAALAMARSAASEARDRAGAFGPLGQVISDVLDQTGVVPRPSRPGAATPGTPPTDGPAPPPADPPRTARPHGATAEPGPVAGAPPADDTTPATEDRPATDDTGPRVEDRPPATDDTGLRVEDPTPATDDAAPSDEDGPPRTDHTGPPAGEVPPQPDRARAGASFGAGFATGDSECCVCPVCRSIAALRDPSPELAERLATGAGDFAAGVASLLRALSSVTGPTGRRSGGSRTGGPSAEDAPTGDNWAAATRATTTETPGTRSADAAETRSADAAETRSADVPGPWRDTVWREATSTRHDSWPADEPDDVWAAATRAEAGTRETGTTAGPDRATPAGAEQARPAASPATGRPPVPASRTPEGPVATGSGEHAAPGEDG